MVKMNTNKGKKLTDNLRLLSEWNYEKNKGILPQELTISSGKKVWWICEKGHEWQARVSNRNRGNGCPYCANKRVLRGYNDLFTVAPHLRDEWDYEKNVEILPWQLTAGSGKKAWWICKKGHKWEACIYSRISGNGCPYCAGEKAISGENDLQTLYPNIVKEWNFNKNIDLNPNEIMPNSNKGIWWICEKGHEWRATPNNRIASHTGCPYCSNETHTSFPEQSFMFYISKYEKVINRYKMDNYEVDLFLPNKKLAIEYDGIYYHSNIQAQRREQRKNKYLKDKGIELIRVKEVESDIEDDQNIYYRNIKKGEKGLDDVIIVLLMRIIGKRIKAYDVDVYRDRQLIWANYINMSKRNSIMDLFPEVSKEWNYKKNLHIRPEHVGTGSHKKVWWECNKGHEWEATVKNRINGRGCPYCSNKKVLAGFNDLLTIRPDLCKEWNYDKNESLPSEYTWSSGKKVWWKCDKGHEWETTIDHRTSGQRCPVCSNKKILSGYNDLKTRFPAIADQWDYEKNYFKPDEVFPFSNKKVWWKCSCGHEWCATINSRCRGNHCPKCHQ